MALIITYVSCELSAADYFLWCHIGCVHSTVFGISCDPTSAYSTY